jgi:polar amino acid transport system substrate-binding protein
MSGMARRSKLVTLVVGLVSLLALGGLVAPVHAGTVVIPEKGKSKTIDQIREQRALRAGTGISLPWVGQDPQTGKFFGTTIEIGERLAQLLGVELKLMVSGWDVMIAGLQGNRYELILAAFFATEKRKQVVDFANYANAGTCFVVLKDNDKIKTLEDLNQPSVTIGTMTGLGSEYGIVAKYTKAKIDSVPQPVSGANRFEDVLTHRIDATFIDSDRALLVARTYPQFKILPGGPDYCIDNPDIPVPLGVAFNYGDPEFKKFLESAIADMRDDIKKSLVKHRTTALEYMLKRQ